MLSERGMGFIRKISHECIQLVTMSRIQPCILYTKTGYKTVNSIQLQPLLYTLLYTVLQALYMLLYMVLYTARVYMQYMQLWTFVQA